MQNDVKNDVQPTMIESIATLLQSLVTVSKSKGRSKVDIGRWDVSKGYPDPLYDDEAPNTMLTPKQASAVLARFCQSVIDSGYKPASKLTTSQHALTLTHTLTSGKNQGNKVPVFAYGLNKVRRDARRVLKADARAAGLVKAQAEGGAWFAVGVTNKDGTGKAFPSEKKARNAWANMTFGADWYKTDKEARKSQASVSRGTYVAFDENTVITSDTVFTSDEALIAAAQKLGSKASTVRGAKTFLARHFS